MGLESRSRYGKIWVDCGADALMKPTVLFITRRTGLSMLFPVGAIMIELRDGYDEPTGV